MADKSFALSFCQKFFFLCAVIALQQRCAGCHLKMKGIFIQESFRRCILNLKIRKHVEIDTSHRNIFTILANHLCHCYLLKYPKDNFLFGITKCCDLLKIIVFASPSHAFAIYSMFSLYCNCGCEKTLKVAEKKRESKPI